MITTTTMTTIAMGLTIIRILTLTLTLIRTAMITTTATLTCMAITISTTLTTVKKDHSLPRLYSLTPLDILFSTPL
jgi:hypothetical protein